ncbi:MAG: GFA family protein [Gammaproteobacteria bacterium]|jgi:hypothetical protein|nr:GFA family protein [Gammaproteobacteria bacterium]
MSVPSVEQKVVHKGGCHCGSVRFEVRAPSTITAYECNCTICSKSGFVHLLVDADDFALLAGEHCLSPYSFNTGTARHLFCRTCGIKSFYVPRSHPHGYSVNVRCLDSGSYTDIHIESFDGANWEAAIDSLR